MSKIFVDLGGTKTLIKFSSKKDFERFLKEFKKEEQEINNEHLYVIFPTIYLKDEQKFWSFFDLLNDIGEVYLIFPEPIYKEKIFSKKFQFLNGKEISFLKEKGIKEVVHDINAVLTYFASQFFKANNKRKRVAVVILGTGINAISVDYFEFKERIYLDKIYEAGHSTFVYDGKMCHCGREGCVERYLSGRYLKDELKVETISSILHIPTKKEEFHKRLAYFLSSLLISQGIDKFYLTGGLTNVIDIEMLKNFIQGVLPFNVEIEFEIEINNDPLLAVKGFEYLLKSNKNNGKSKGNGKKSKK